MGGGRAAGHRRIDPAGIAQPAFRNSIVDSGKSGSFFLQSSPFERFLSFGHGRKAVFAVFYLSAVAEMQFSLFFIFRPWPKRSFRCFSSFGRGRNAVFAVFCLSAVAERQFLLFFICRRPTTDDFRGIFGFPRARKRGKSCFLSIRGLGKFLFGNFCPSEGSDGLFSIAQKP